jgi:CheY-like chemotaxis protein
MPGAGGLQTLLVLRNTPETSHIPAIVVSGISPRILGLMPAAAYLVKPVERRVFIQAIRKYINPSYDTRQQPENAV